MIFLSSLKNSILKGPSVLSRGLGVLHRFELNYAQDLPILKPDFPSSLTTLLSLEKSYQTFLSYNNSLQKYSPPGPLWQDVFKDYNEQITFLHRENLFWLYLYLDMIWPRDIPANLGRKLRKDLKDVSIPKQAEANWQQLANERSWPADIFPRIARLTAIKQERDKHPLNSYLWRKVHQELIRNLYDVMRARHNRSKQELDNCFTKTVYASAAAGPDRFLSTEISAAGLKDWVKGYKQPNSHEQEAARMVKGSLEPQLKIMQWRRLAFVAARNTVTALILAGLCFAFYTSPIPKKFIFPVFAKIQTFLRMNPLLLKERKKYDFFYNHILDISNKYRPEELSANIDYFVSNKSFSEKEKYYYFADKILRNFLPLLSDGKADAGLRSKVLGAAELLNKDVAVAVSGISDLFSGNIMRESELRKFMFELRRILVQYDVFPFMFIALRGQAPYLFLFPERITGRFFFQEKDFNQLELNTALYVSSAQLPLTAYVVAGTEYPFRERAGYFEGEFAIVFANLAMRTEWTAWHELAHVVDQLRKKYGNVPYPQNIELNAMLFPAIFVEDAKEYMVSRLLPILETADKGDTYVQSAKAIFNGFSLFAASRGVVVLPVITDNFEKENIQAVANFIYSLTDEEIRHVALRVFQSPQEYIRDLQTGQYKGVISNAEELIRGTPSAPQQGFILDGYDEGGFSLPFGPRFLLDGTIRNENPTASSNTFSFLKRMFGIIFNRSAYASIGYEAERVAAAIVTFVLVEAFFIFIAALATPLRRRKFYGRSLKSIVNAVYDRNPLSDGRSYGLEKGERELLMAVFDSAGQIPESLRADIGAFRKSADERKCGLFDLLLTLAPFSPKVSEVKSATHNFLFWIPFIGPVAARAPWLFPKQKAFSEREAFNRAVEDLAIYAAAEFSTGSIEKSFPGILAEYKDLSSSPGAESGPATQEILDIRQLSLQYLNDLTRDRDVRRPFKKQKTSSGHNERSDFERLDKYSPGDDIKLIDWKSTARSANNEPKIRHLGNSFGTRVCFLFDFRGLNRKTVKEKIAFELSSSLKTLQSGIDLHLLLLIMPDGDIIKHSVPGYVTIPECFRSLWSVIEKYFQEYTGRVESSRLTGLRFYAPAENRIYQNIIGLTGRNQESPEGRISRPCPLYSQNIFMIGVTWENRAKIEHVLTAHNQFYYWPEIVPALN